MVQNYLSALSPLLKGRIVCVCALAAVLTMMPYLINAQPAMLKTLAPGSNNFVTAGSILYYASGDSLWRSNGTPEGTQLLMAVGEPIKSISSLRIQEQIFFITQSGTNESLWTSKGTASTTKKLGTHRSILPVLVSDSHRLILSIDDGIHGRELWAADYNSLLLLRDIYPGPQSGFFGEATNSAGFTFIFGYSETGKDIWRTGSYANSTSKLVDLPFNDASRLTAIPAGNVYFFREFEDEFGEPIVQLWKKDFDPFADEVSFIKEFPPAAEANTITLTRAFKGKLYFIHNVSYFYHLMVSDGTAVGTQIVKEEIAVDGSHTGFVEVNDHLFMAEQTQGYAGYIHKSDGTSAGTQRFHDLANEYYHHGVEWVNLTGSDDMLYFVDNTGVLSNEYPYENNFQLFRTDQNLQNPRSLESIYGISFEGTDNVRAAEANSVFFTTQWLDGPMRLWFYDPEKNPACDGVGGVSREVWTNVSGATVSQIPLSEEPDYTEVVDNFQGPTNAGDRYGSRYRAYLCIRETGDYIFMISSNDYSELWLSTSTDPDDKIRIAYVNGATPAGSYGQPSNFVHLEGGNLYYIEALHKEGVGSDHLSVSMRLPDFTIESPIDGSRLIPFTGEIQQCATGTILREEWTGVEGSSVSSVPVNTAPDNTEQLNIFEGPVNAGIHYGSRIRGYICPPQSGAYVFYISSNDHSELWLSTDDDPANKTRIAYVQGASAYRGWYKYPSQRSATIWLTEGTKYYIEALHKQGVGTDHISVGWLLPDGGQELPIPGSRLSPAEVTTEARAAEDVAFARQNDEEQVLSVSPNPAAGEKITIRLTGLNEENSGPVRVELISSLTPLGQGISTLCDNNCDEIVMDTNALTPGIYFVTASVGGKRFTKRLVVK